MKSNTQNFAVILAGGDGNRLKSLTRIITGDERPKQFCPILNNKTLLDITRKRVELKIKPENVFYSLTQKHEEFYQSNLFDVAKSNLVIQSENKGTAPAILYSLVKIAVINPNATVAFFPSDHYFSNDEALMSNVEKAFQKSEETPQSIVLLGIKPEKPETSYGWIEPTETILSTNSPSTVQVKRFWEKPSFESAKYLFMKGCLWNSFVMIGKVSAFLEIIKQKLPTLYQLFDSSKSVFNSSDELPTMGSLYTKINDINFSSEVLEKCVRNLLVLRVSNTSWSDWGEPSRVLGTLSNLGVKTDWMIATA